MIVRTRPFTPAFDQRVDRMFADLTRSMTTTRTPEVVAAWHEGALRLTVDLPGTPDEAISLDVADRTLTIAVDHEGTAWQRSVKLGAQLDPSQVSARYAHGRLTVDGGTRPPSPRSADRDRHGGRRRHGLGRRRDDRATETTEPGETEPGLNRRSAGRVRCGDQPHRLG